MVECLLAKEDVASSSLVSRSIKKSHISGSFLLYNSFSFNILSFNIHQAPSGSFNVGQAPPDSTSHKKNTEKIIFGTRDSLCSRILLTRD